MMVIDRTGCQRTNIWTRPTCCSST